MLDNADTKSSALNIFSFFWRLQYPQTDLACWALFMGHRWGNERVFFYWYSVRSFLETILWVLKVLPSTILWKHHMGKPTVMLSPTLWNEFLTQLLLHLILCQGPKGCQDYLSECENIVPSICPLPQYCQEVVLSGTSEIFSGSISRA